MSPGGVGATGAYVWCDLVKWIVMKMRMKNVHDILIASILHCFSLILTPTTFPSRPVTSYHITSHRIMTPSSDPIRSHLISFHITPSHLTSSHPISSHPIPSGLISPSHHTAKTHETFIGPPLDEEDGASRVLDPVFSHILSGGKDRAHGNFYKDYFKASWWYEYLKNTEYGIQNTEYRLFLDNARKINNSVMQCSLFLAAILENLMFVLGVTGSQTSRWIAL